MLGHKGILAEVPVFDGLHHDRLVQLISGRNEAMYKEDVGMPGICDCPESELLGVVNLGKELWGESWGRLEHWVDASACRSIELRRGTGTIKHLSLKVLWIQEAI